MNSAIEIGRYFLKHALGAFQLMGAEKEHQDAKYILRQLEKQNEVQLKKYDIFRLCRGRFKKTKDLEPGIDLLCEHNYLRVVPPKKVETAGRPTENSYLLNPKHFGYSF